MILVTGANGHLGRAILTNLLDRGMPAAQLVGTARDPQKATALTERGVSVRPGDFADPAGLAAAFAGATQVLLVSPDKLGEEKLRLSHNAITAARAAGAQRVLYTSHMGVYADSPTQDQVFIKDHAATERFLAETGRPYTALRNGFYTESALHLIGQGFEAGEIRAPEDGPVSWTTRADLAEANAAVLAAAGRYDGPTPPLVAPAAYTLAELAALASELLGREVRRVTLTDEQWHGEKIAQGTPPPVADFLLGTYRAMRRGDFAATDPTLEHLLGRRPATMREVLTERLRPATS